jgi:malonate-semialdehyde dehydrogenase (acetylating)/methylmalonate-semialdehyde dehydrogenase
VCLLISSFLVSQKELAKSITAEQGKTLIDAEGDVLRGLRKKEFLLSNLVDGYYRNGVFCWLIIFFFEHLTEVVEHACSITSLQLGESMQGIAKDMDAMSYRVPLGVCAGITPFNFPAMIPLWV